MKIKTILCTLCAVTVLGSCSYDVMDCGMR